MSRPFVFAQAFAFLAVALTAAAQTYTITDLGVLKGNNESSGFWLNNLGQVVGCSDVQTVQGYPCTGTQPGQHAFLWSKATGMLDLGTLPGGNISGGVGINDSGAVVGYSNNAAMPALDYVAFVWSADSGMVNLGTLPQGTSSAAFQINSSGVIVGDSFKSTGLVAPTTWTDGKIRNLGMIANSVFDAGLGINNNGQVVGESVFSYGPPFLSHAFTWKSGAGMRDLGTLPGGVTSSANAINSAGTAVGQSDGTATGGLWHAVLWDTAKKIHDLGTLAGGTYSIAFGINDSNQIVGYGNLANNAPHAMIWTAGAGMQDLNTMISGGSGWVLINANAINSVRQITGYGAKNGHNHAFLLTPKN